MTDAEADYVIRETLIVFPQLGQWFDFKLTPEVSKATFKSWVAALRPQDKDDTLAILDEWRDGRRESPAAYDRERVIYIMAELARMRKSNRVAKHQSKAILDQATPTPEQIEERRQQYRPIADADKLMGEAMRRKVACLPQIPRAQWTRQQEVQYIDDMNRIDAEYAKAIGCEPLPPLQYFHLRKNSNPSQQPEPQPAEEFYAWQ